MITQNYIKMCEKAEEMQKAWKPVDWDRFIYKNDKTVGMGCGHIKSYMKVWYVWLPTQEQLQEMMTELSNEHFFKNFPKNYIPQKDEYVFPIHLLWWFSQWVVFQKRAETKECSLNELWLAFVMYEKYHKIWTGEKWVKADD